MQAARLASEPTDQPRLNHAAAAATRQRRRSSRPYRVGVYVLIRPFRSGSSGKICRDRVPHDPDAISARQLHHFTGFRPNLEPHPFRSSRNDSPQQRQPFRAARACTFLIPPPRQRCPSPKHIANLIHGQSPKFRAEGVMLFRFKRLNSATPRTSTRYFSR